MMFGSKFVKWELWLCGQTFVVIGNFIGALFGSERQTLLCTGGAAGALIIIGAAGYLGSYLSMDYYPGNLLAQFVGAFVAIHLLFHLSIFREKEFAYPG